MPQGYYARKMTIQQGPKKGETAYAVQPYYYGTLTTEDMAQQIASESAMTVGDVKSVIEGMQRYVRTNLGKGYKVELLGFGLVCNRFRTAGTAATADKVTANLIKAVIPGFEPAFTLINKRRRYSLMPERTLLQKFRFKGSVAVEDTPTEELKDNGDDGDGKDNGGQGDIVDF